MRLTAIFARRSVRAYTGAPISERDVTALLEAGMAAPSARGLDPWRFVVVTDRHRLDRLAGLHPYAGMLGKAGACIAVCGDRGVSPDFWVQDCSAATQNILVAAGMLGLGAVWLGVHPREEREAGLKEYLRVPGECGVLCLVAVGVPVTQPEPRTRYDDMKIHREAWRQEER